MKRKLIRRVLAFCTAVLALWAAVIGGQSSSLRGALEEIGKGDNALRLLRATRMLKCTDKPVTCICYECGFESQCTFNRAFREHYGVTPTEYRTDWGREAP